jgi:hypothetical protein
MQPKKIKVKTMVEFENRRQPQKLLKEEDLNVLLKGRQPQFFLKEDYLHHFGNGR